MLPLVIALFVIGGLIAMGLFAYWMSLTPTWIVRAITWALAALVAGYVVALSIKGALH